MADPYSTGGGGDGDREGSEPTEVAGQLTTGAQGDLSIIAGIPASSIDSEGLISTGEVVFQYRNILGTVGGGSDYDVDVLSETLGVELEDFGTESMGIFTQKYAGVADLIVPDESTGVAVVTETTFRMYAPFQNFDPESPVILPNPSGVLTEDWHIEYNENELEGLAKSFPYLPSGTTAQDLIEQEMLSMAKEVLQTFPSTELHFSKAKHPRLLDGNLRAFRTREVGQGVSLGLTMTNVEEESSEDPSWG